MPNLIMVSCTQPGETTLTRTSRGASSAATRAKLSRPRWRSPRRSFRAPQGGLGSDRLTHEPVPCWGQLRSAPERRRSGPLDEGPFRVNWRPAYDRAGTAVHPQQRTRSQGYRHGSNVPHPDPPRIRTAGTAGAKNSELEPMPGSVALLKRPLGARRDRIPLPARYNRRGD